MERVQSLLPHVAGEVCGACGGHDAGDDLQVVRGTVVSWRRCHPVPDILRAQQLPAVQSAHQDIHLCHLR